MTKEHFVATMPAVSVGIWAGLEYTDPPEIVVVIKDRNGDYCCLPCLSYEDGRKLRDAVFLMGTGFTNAGDINDE